MVAGKLMSSIAAKLRSDRLALLLLIGREHRKKRTA